MKNSYTLRSVPTQNVDLEDTSYELTPWTQEPGIALIESIQQFGILHPPLLLQKERTLCIVTGRKRIITACQCLPDQKIPSLVIGPEVESKHILMLLLEEILGRRMPSVVEQAIFFEKFLTEATPDDAMPLLNRLGYKSNEYILRKLLKLLSLHTDILRALHKNVLSMNNALKLATFMADDQILIIRLIIELKLGGSKQRKLIEMSEELVKRTQKPLQQIFQECQFSVDGLEVDNIPQQVARLLTCLEEKCFPLSREEEKKFTEKIEALDLPSGITVEHTPSFEDEAITLAINFTDWQSFARALPEILTVLKTK